MMKLNGETLYVELAKCMACKGCEIACALEHSESKDLFTAVREEPLPMSRVTLEAVDGAAIPLQCRHCEDAPCVTVCPTDALHRISPGQPVLIDEERCIGCKMCVVVCPFGVIALRPGGKVALKCDLCLGRLESGDQPACVAGCPTGAMQFLKIDEITRRKREAAARAAMVAETAAKDRK